MGFAFKTPSGKWQANWREPSGKQRSKTFRTKREADQFMAEMETAKTRGAYVSPHAWRMLFKDHAAQWMATRRTQATTNERDVSHMRNHVVAKWGEWKLSAIDEISIQEWVTEMTGRLASQTVSKCLQLTAGVLKSAVRNRLIAINPADEVKVPSNRQRDTDDRIIERAQLRGLLLPQVPRKYRALVAVAGGTGLRWGELVGLRADAVDLEARQVRVVRTVIEVGGVTKYKQFPKSTAGRRVVPLPTWAAVELRRHLRDRPRGEHGLIFPNELGRPLRRSLFRGRVWRPSLVRAGLLGRVIWTPAGFEARWTDKEHSERQAQFDRYNEAVRQINTSHAHGLRFHDLRHSYGTWLADQGVPVNKVQRVMGHEHVSTTLQLYVRKTEDHDSIRDALDDE